MATDPKRDPSPKLKHKFKDVGAKRDARQRALRIKGGRNLLVILAGVYFVFGCLLFTLIGMLLQGIPSEEPVALSIQDIEQLERQYLQRPAPDNAGFDRACKELLQTKREDAEKNRTYASEHPEVVAAGFYWGQALIFLLLFFYAAKQPLKAMYAGLALYVLVQAGFLLTIPGAFRGAGGWLIRIAIVYVFLRAIRAHAENARLKAQAELKKELQERRRARHTVEETGGAPAETS